MEMGQYIMSILKIQTMIVWSWGFNAPRAIENGLIFRVQAFIHNGWVKVVYNEGSDLFDVILLTSKMVEKESHEGIYFDMLVDVIDNAVENCKNYEKRVENEYSLL